MLNPIRALRNAPFPSFAISSIEQRLDPNTGVRGMYCVGQPIPAETLVACIPVFACISPATVLSTKVGKRLAERLKENGYTSTVGAGKMDVSFESMLVASFTAVSMSRGPLKEYLANICVERDASRLLATVSSLGGPMVVEKYTDLQKASLEVLKDAHRDATTGRPGEQGAPTSLSFTLEELVRANALCESRVLSVPSDVEDMGVADDSAEVDLLGGPALIPWFDLVNHSDTASNIAAAVMRTDRLPAKFAQIAPLCVVGATRREVSVGEEITYEYAEVLPDARTVLSEREYQNRLLLWATRFHFIPPHML